MAQTDIRLSPCHFTSLTDDIFASSEDTMFCTHCGKPVDKPFIVPSVNTDTLLELTVRRYKDGDVDYNTVANLVNMTATELRADFLRSLREATDDGQPSEYILSGVTGRWELVQGS